ncbi:hypothetical protein [Halalkalibacterium halodurans]|uniref:hypothetical protein n=1 Tax=Halalkalibacterium halodurans TaxID=86665 RepID=UPI002E217B77|nr:hypothetical protein [Halalkalibacterium halodurans]MED4110930.1 hypothetical protein [Halalkalibacterium halodurans]MED4150607.1 hypothetical protein [Halalkalibacterium halodurans]MED4192670.1 hypothetical protein [Halalkalibacterium halodurans]MED4196720.1 hypothetical protein [Halalkalibacterium halodurans]
MLIHGAIDQAALYFSINFRQINESAYWRWLPSLELASSYEYCQAALLEYMHYHFSKLIVKITRRLREKQGLKIHRGLSPNWLKPYPRQASVF